jgi:calcineurin-like phosphoesterase family protein
VNWFTADLHMGHASVIDYCKRPFNSVGDMDEALISNWNESVEDDDTVYCLGDVSFHKPSIGVPLLKRLKGKKILIQGNHDKYSMTQYELGGFTCVLQECVIKLFGIEVRLSHFPYKPYFWERWLKLQDTRYLNKRPQLDDKWLLCGHVHNTWRFKDKMINVGVDEWGYRPVSDNELQVSLRMGWR